MSADLGYADADALARLDQELQLTDGMKRPLCVLCVSPAVLVCVCVCVVEFLRATVKCTVLGESVTVHLKLTA